MTVYLDTSAPAKLLVAEAESDALADYLDALEDQDGLVSSVLLETELRRLAAGHDVPQRSVSEVLARVALAQPDRALFVAAGLLPGSGLRSLDALHLPTPLRMGADVVVAYDQRLLAAESLGLVVHSPHPAPPGSPRDSEDRCSEWTSTTRQTV